MYFLKRTVVNSLAGLQALQGTLLLRELSFANVDCSQVSFSGTESDLLQFTGLLVREAQF